MSFLEKIRYVLFHLLIVGRGADHYYSYLYCNCASVLACLVSIVLSILGCVELLVLGGLLVEEFIVVSADGVNVKSSRADNSVVDIVPVPVPPSIDNSVLLCISVCVLIMGVDNKEEEAVTLDDLRRGETFSCCCDIGGGGGGGGISASDDIILSSLSVIFLANTYVCMAPLFNCNRGAIVHNI